MPVGPKFDSEAESLELVDLVIAHHPYMKRVGPELARRGPSEESAQHLLQHLRAGRVPPFLAAFLFGQIAHPIAYSAVLEILLAAHGMLAESYAGVALARILGQSAVPDLVRTMHSAEHQRSRDGAAWGLASLPLASETAVAAYDAGLRRRIHDRTAAAVLSSKNGMSQEAKSTVLRLFTTKLAHEDEQRRILILTETCWNVLLNNSSSDAMVSLLHELTPELVDILKNPTMRMSPRKRTALQTWVDEERRITSG